MTAQPSRRVVIVGGVAGGASAAARLRRLDEKASITIFERGPDVSFANCGLPYHIGGEIAERGRLLVTTPARLAARFRIDVHVLTEVVSIDREAKLVKVRKLQDGSERDEPYDALILSPGASPIVPPPFSKAPPHPRICTLRNLGDMDAIIAALPTTTATQSGNGSVRRAVVIGGGYIGLELAENLVNRGSKGEPNKGTSSIAVTVVELAPQVMGVGDPEMTAPLLDELVNRGVDVLLSTKVDSMDAPVDSEDGKAPIVLQLSNGRTIEADLVVVAVGVRPDSSLAQAAGLAVGARTRGIVVDNRMRTTDPSIYAVGDAVQIQEFVTGAPVSIPLAGPANRQGRVAADNIVGRGDSVYNATQGTAIVRVFAQAFALTGLTEKMARRGNISYAVAHTHAVSHASYFPGSSTVHLKLLYSPHTGRVLGAQAVGADGVDKRIDIISTAIRAKMTVEDLANLELCYAPPFGSAKDAVNFIGMAAYNNLCGDVKLRYVADADAAGQGAADESPAKVQRCASKRIKLLDVRTAAEGDRVGAIRDDSPGGYLNIPVDDLRAAIADGTLQDKSVEYLVYCAVGVRAYVACCILKAHGFNASNLSGGYTTYAMAKRSEAAAAAAAAAAVATKSDHSAVGTVARSAEFALFYPHSRPEGSRVVQQLPASKI